MKKTFDFTQETYSIYQQDIGFGFLTQTSVFPSRSLYPENLVTTPQGIVMPACAEHAYYHNMNDYDYIGLGFRVDLPAPGTYRVEVVVNSSPATTKVTVCGMQADQIILSGFWDAARRIPRVHTASYSGNVWSFDFVCPYNYIEIEVEPTAPELEVGISSISLTPLSSTPSTPSELPTIYTIGDSTVKSYIYEENLMSAWGQIFDNFYDTNCVRVLNYSMGGRSLSSLYREGRMNDLLLQAKPGDYVLLQSGHNDESTGELAGPEARFGRGNTPETFTRWLDNYFIPAAKLRGIQLILVSPMTRIHGDKTGAEQIIFCGFAKSDSIDCPRLLKEAADRHNLPFIDLYTLGIDYLEQIGGEAAKALYLSVEAGETPGKTNSGSYANGHPDNKCDGTHYKEGLSKQFARIVANELYRQNLHPKQFFLPYVREAFEKQDAYMLFPEMSVDVQTGSQAYYRNQIEFLIKHQIMAHDEKRCFYPKENITIGEFKNSLCRACKLDHFPTIEELTDYGKILSGDLLDSSLLEDTLALSREKMAWLIYRVYLALFPITEMPPEAYDLATLMPPYVKPPYMTDYNGVNISFDHPDYDPNLTGESAMYYPLVPWEQLTDHRDISAPLYQAVKECYRLGLMRSEHGIARGRMQNGSLFEPQLIVTKEKAAKELYFLQTFTHSIYDETDEY